MGTVLVKSSWQSYFGSQTHLISIWTTASLSQHGDKWRRKSHRLASPTVSPNWYLDNAQNLCPYSSCLRGSSLPLVPTRKPQSQNYACTISSYLFASSVALSSESCLGCRLCSSSWMYPTLIAQHMPASSLLAWWGWRRQFHTEILDLLAGDLLGLLLAYC